MKICKRCNRQANSVSDYCDRCYPRYGMSSSRAKEIAPDDVLLQKAVKTGRIALPCIEDSSILSLRQELAMVTSLIKEKWATLEEGYDEQNVTKALIEIQEIRSMMPEGPLKKRFTKIEETLGKAKKVNKAERELQDLIRTKGEVLTREINKDVALKSSMSFALVGELMKRLLDSAIGVLSRVKDDTRERAKNLGLSSDQIDQIVQGIENEKKSMVLAFKSIVDAPGFATTTQVGDEP